jgi:hypothetical protein
MVWVGLDNAWPWGLGFYPVMLQKTQMAAAIVFLSWNLLFAVAGCLQDLSWLVLGKPWRGQGNKVFSPFSVSFLLSTKVYCTKVEIRRVVFVTALRWNKVLSSCYCTEVHCIEVEICVLLLRLRWGFAAEVEISTSCGYCTQVQFMIAVWAIAYTFPSAKTAMRCNSRWGFASLSPHSWIARPPSFLDFDGKLLAMCVAVLKGNAVFVTVSSTWTTQVAAAILLVHSWTWLLFHFP